MSAELHIGLTPWRLGPDLDAERLCRQAELAEAWGFDSFFLPETHFVEATPIPDPMLLLAAAAARTRRIQLGTTSYLLPIRNPVLAAEQVASLDRLSGGRLILGLGRGYQTDMLDVFGVNHLEKRARFSDTLDAMQAAWRGEAVGGVDSALTLAPRPRQAPHPPLWIAAFGPKAIAQIGRLGLPYLASPVESFTELADNLRLHREALSTHGHSPPDTVAIMRTIFISDDTARLALVRKNLAHLPSPPFRKNGQTRPDEWCLLGSAMEVEAKIQRHREALGMTHLIAVRPRVGGIDESWLAESFAALAALRDRGAATAQPGA